jgi:predicted ribosome quality control (RQC) complex YloA/Tae2 family protein
MIELNPDKSPGENLERLYVQIKKLERALSLQGERTRKLKDQIEQFEAALSQLKNPTNLMPQSEINPLLATLGLEKAKSANKPSKLPKTSKSGLGRKFLLGEQVLLTLGRDAKESDQIVKSARSSDWWVHIAGGGRGSHVIISGLPSKVPLPAHIAKAAGILALHFSERSNACEGEVYCTRRQFIRKQKGLAPGLWLVDKSETVLIRYTPSDVAEIFAKELRDGIQRHKVSD